MILTNINLAIIPKPIIKRMKRIHNQSRLSLVFFFSLTTVAVVFGAVVVVRAMVVVVFGAVVVVRAMVVVVFGAVVVTEIDVVVVLAESHGGVTSVLMTTGDTRASLR